MKLSLLFIYLSLFFFINPHEIRAQYNYGLPQYFDETRKFLRAPLSWSGGDWLKVAGVAAGTAALMFTDDYVNSIAVGSNHLEGTIPMEIGRLWGEPVTPLILGLALLVQGNLSENEANRKLGFEILQSHSYNLFVTGVLKITLGRGRPYLNEGQFSFNPLYFKPNDYWSLPSGHTSIAFTLSTVLSNNTSSTPLRAVYYSLAGITALSRLVYNKHWLSDVFLGAVIGYAIGKFVTDLHKDRFEEAGSSPVNLISFSIGIN